MNDITDVQRHINIIKETDAMIRRGFFTIGEHLIEIKEQLPNQASFLKMVKAELGYSKSTAYRFMAAKVALENLSPRGDNLLPEDEKVIRPLTEHGLNDDPERQAELWNTVVEQAGDKKITAAMVRKVVSPPKPKVEKSVEPKTEYTAEEIEQINYDGYREGYDACMRDDAIEQGKKVLSDTEAQALKTTMRKLQMQLHPDKGGNEETAQLLNDAYALINKLI